MLNTISRAGVGAIKVPDQTDSHKPDTVQMDSDDEQWFAAVVRRLLPKDAGFALHLETGFDERSCYRYASGERAIPSYMLRELLRGPNGWQWLCGTLDGCTAPWWIELQTARDFCSKFKIEPR